VFQALEELPLVEMGLEAAAFGRPDKTTRETICVFVEPNALQLKCLTELVEGKWLAVHLSPVDALAEATKAHKGIETCHARGNMAPCV
jgi:hypothetical protein